MHNLTNDYACLRKRFWHLLTMHNYVPKREDFYENELGIIMLFESFPNTLNQVNPTSGGVIIVIHFLILVVIIRNYMKKLQIPKF